VQVVLGTDEEAPVVAAIEDRLRALGHVVVRVAAGEDWPEVGRAVASAVVRGEATIGVCCCHTGTGVSIAANKLVGIRAALCTDAGTAVGARRWNDANVLAIGVRQTSSAIATEIVDAFFSTSPDLAELDTIARVEP
jgi:ribose 5-phosphate isomerase B